MGILNLFTDMFFAGENADVAKETTAENQALLEKYFGIGQGGLQPWMDRGNQAGGQYNAFLMGDPAAFEQYKQSTGFKTNLQEGTNALSQNAATRGMLHSGGTLKAAQQYGQDLNSQYADKYLSHLAVPMGYGAGAAGNLAGLASGTGNALAGNNWTGAQGQWAANQSRANAFSNFFDDAEKMAGQFYGGG